MAQRVFGFLLKAVEMVAEPVLVRSSEGHELSLVMAALMESLQLAFGVL